jgi:lipopolysaccharide biosynthesis glycosyltransferase
VIVACATDRRFTQLAGVMLASLFDKGEVGDDWRVIVFGYRLRRRDEARLRACCGVEGDRLEFIDIDPKSDAFAGLLPTSFSANPSIFIRLVIPSLLPEENGRLLYLDSDTLVQDSLQPLAAIDLDGSAIGAVEDDNCHPKHDGRLPLSPDVRYFNSGVMLIDLQRWRSEDLTNRALGFARANAERLAFPDQDALNGVVAGHFKLLDAPWNVTRPIAETSCRHPKIVHYTGTKPWSAACKHPSRDLFLRYRSGTPWRDARLLTRFETRMMRSLYKRRVALKRLWMRIGPA